MSLSLSLPSIAPERNLQLEKKFALRFTVKKTFKQIKSRKRERGTQTGSPHYVELEIPREIKFYAFSSLIEFNRVWTVQFCFHVSTLIASKSVLSLPLSIPWFFNSRNPPMPELGCFFESSLDWAHLFVCILCSVWHFGENYSRI